MNELDELDKKLTSTFDGKVVRKDPLHRIKKGTNVLTFNPGISPGAVLRQ